MAIALALLLAGCGGGGDGGTEHAATPQTTTAAPVQTGPCGLRPLSFANERWEGSSVAGAECLVPVERLTTGPAPAHVMALPSCEPLPAVAPC